MKKWIILYSLLTAMIPMAIAQQLDTLQQEEGALQTQQNQVIQLTDSQSAAGPALIDTVPHTDGFYQANNLEDAVPFAFPEVDRKNIRFYKRVWRDIDLDNEANFIYAVPGN